MPFQRERFLKELIDYNPSVILIVISADGIVVDFNYQMTALYGWEPSQILERSYLEIGKEFKTPFPTKTILSLLKNQTDKRQELLTKSLKNKQVFYIRWRVYSSNDHSYFFFSGTEVEGVDNENDTKRFLYNLIDNIPHYIFWKNNKSIFMGCNQAFARLVGLNDAKEIIGKSDFDLPWSKQESELYIQDDQKIMKSGKAKIDYEEIQTLAFGAQRVGLVSKVPIKNELDEVTGLLCIYTDITQKKREETQLKEAIQKSEAANQAKTNFMLNMQHDIRTPLSGIYGMVELLASQEVSENIKEDLLDVAQCAKELLEFFNEIIDFSNIDRGSLPVVEAPFHLQDVVQEIMALELPAANFKKLDLSLTYDDSIPAVLLGDAYRLKRILINLVGNAIKFTKVGYVKIKIDTERVSLKNRELIVKFLIEDTGIGIPEEKKEMIYEKFSKVISSNKGLYKGSGLGLKIVKQFVSEMNGDIYVDTHLNQGTLFKIFLPFKIPLSQSVLESNRR